VSTGPSWEDLAGDLPAHADEVMAAHQGAPSIAEQNASHGAPAPPGDRGADDRAKYC
jgi:hypothetical protein